jgi:hypothetical protein
MVLKFSHEKDGHRTDCRCNPLQQIVQAMQGCLHHHVVAALSFQPPYSIKSQFTAIECDPIHQIKIILSSAKSTNENSSIEFSNFLTKKKH